MSIRASDGKGRIALPVEMLLGALADAGRIVRNGRRLISTSRKSSLRDMLTIQDEFLSLANDAKSKKISWNLHKCWGHLGSTRICIVRPQFPHWHFTTRVSFDETKVSEETVRKLFEIAGSQCGLGSFRPSVYGPFGRFKIIKWQRTRVIASRSAA